MINKVCTVFTIILLTVCSLSYGQDGTLHRYICNSTVSLNMMAGLQAPKSDGICSEGTRVQGEILSGASLIQDLRVIRLDEVNGWHDVRLEIDWVPGQTGLAVVKISYQRKLQGLPFVCEWEPWTELITYTFHKGVVNNPGELTGEIEHVRLDPQTDPVSLNLVYDVSDANLNDLDLSQVRWWNGTTTQVKDLDNSFFDRKTNLPFQTTSFGPHVIQTEVKDRCNVWHPGASIVVTVFPTCYNNDPSTVSIGLEGTIKDTYDDGARKIVPHESYTLVPAGITDFSANYTWSTDGGSDIQLAGNTFIISAGIGSYTISASPKTGREECPVPASLKFFVLGDEDGKDLVVDKICPIVFPRDIPDIEGISDPDNLVLKHFVVTAKSDESITIMPGVTLELGAEIAIEQTDPGPGSDQNMNFTEVVIYDEYGRMVRNTRSYFDERGLPVQTQSKNFSRAVVMADATLYDAYGRAAISTLSAPVSAYAGPESGNDAEGCAIIPKEKIDFAFKAGFVKASTETDYDYKNFDLKRQEGTVTSKEDSPDPVYGSTEGTLGWYYGTNNGTSSNPRFNEPLVATTQYPYSRTVFHRDGTGDVKSTTRPGDAFRAGGGHLANVSTEIVAANDTYLEKYLDMREAELGLTSDAVAGDFLRAVVTDEKGRKSVTYTDRSEQPVISIYFDAQGTLVTKSYQFYDLAGRLLVEVSPNGVAQYERTVNPVPFSFIDKTTYAYNLKGWLVSMEETDAEITNPDGSIVKGRTEYIYRKDGNIRYSQNPKQSKSLPHPTYSYTNYDRAGRPIESGEYIVKDGGVGFKSAAMMATLESIAADGGMPVIDNNKRDKVTSFYDAPDPELPAGRVQRFTQGVVSYTKKDDLIVTSYSYDEQGRIEWMVQKIEGLGTKTIDYRYGPTGQVQEVLYQKGSAGEQFSHFYEYDADGRLFKAYTTTEALIYNKLGRITNSGVTYDGQGNILNGGSLKLQATYIYYLHGPLKRVELADKLQGIDYVYTADGALKAVNNANPDVNATTAAEAKDPGKDGFGNGFRKDVFGMTLEYFHDDYTAANDVTDNATIPEPAYPQQHGGLIRAMRWHSPTEADKQFAYAYQYDNRDQFAAGDWDEIKNGSFSPGADADPDAYREKVAGYDLNGNIVSLERKNAEGVNIANFAYEYVPNTNKLEKILNKDDNNKVLKAYQYNEIGELKSETGDSEKYIEYDVTGKVTKVFRDSDKTKLAVLFTYDDRGFRLSKTSYDENGVAQLRTWYVRDALGNVMGTYEQNLVQPQAPKITELPVYASGRIGLYKPEFDFTMYELTDHLGNVRAVIGKTLEVEYLATMESERLSNESADLEGYFEDVQNDVTATDFNHTPAVVTVNGITENIADPNEVARLNNRPNGTPDPNPVGTGIMLTVHPGDVINAEVFVKYADFNASDENIVAGLAGFLTTAFGPSPGRVDVPSIFNVVDEPAFALMPAWSKLNDEQPRAFLNYLLFDNDFTLKGYDFAQVSSAAKITETVTAHERLTLENIKIEKEGFIYIYVSNQSDQNMDVYFDDLRVKHTYSDIVAGGDFYPFGLGINDRQIQRDLYRYGYQGQFSEKDDETGWNHFELREYDPVIGRWMVPDPKGQHWSPYVAMGNNPANSVDEQGGEDGPIFRYGDCKCSKVIDGQRITEYSNGIELMTLRYYSGFNFSIFWDNFNASSSNFTKDLVDPLYAKSWGQLLDELSDIVPTIGEGSLLTLEEVKNRDQHSNEQLAAAFLPMVISRKPWKLTSQAASSIKVHSKFGTFYKSKSDGTWWSTDKAGHGGSRFKVFEETKTGLRWKHDADLFGDYIIGKHKGETGMFIPWKDLRGSK